MRQADRDLEWDARLRTLGGACIDVINSYEETGNGGIDHPTVVSARDTLTAVMDELYGELPPPPELWLRAVR